VVTSLWVRNFSAEVSMRIARIAPDLERSWPDLEFPLAGILDKFVQRDAYLMRLLRRCEISMPEGYEVVAAFRTRMGSHQYTIDSEHFEYWLHEPNASGIHLLYIDPVPIEIFLHCVHLETDASKQEKAVRAMFEQSMERYANRILRESEALDKILAHWTR
jgi:hypothetical protein